ncbi:hypothetical protein [Bradyrhizobium sp. ARR65]|uniref:hypothetical protein n=1 Tax=Bradyrhizobium sp. ARR65 TaxID=1040989 RepID=UPI0004658D85|nr:hypothetical protein [Bradyrhizobium sp. ARR65]
MPAPSAKQFREYFDFWRFLQEKLVSLLDAFSKSRRDFLTFPDNINPIELVFDPMSDVAAKLYKRYITAETQLDPEK